MQALIELDIEPGPDPGTYLVRVSRAVGGGRPSAVVSLDVDDLLARRRTVEANILAAAVRARRVVGPEESVIREVGRELFERVFDGGIGETYRTSRAVAAERGRELQLRLRTRVPELAALPWETLFDPEAGTYVSRRDPLVRVVPARHVRDPLEVEPPLRVLAMVAAPANLVPIDVAEERERLEQALAAPIAAGQVEVHWLEDVSWRGLHAALLSGRWHVLHFIGHGLFDEARDEGMLAFVGRDGRAEFVAAGSLADLLDEADPTPRLVVLNSCASAAAGSTDLFSGTAAALVRSGIDAVVAMQFSISDDAAIEFANGFYTSLGSGRTVDLAARSGRIGILGLGPGTLEWVTPVLYLRGDESRLFEMVGEPVAQAPAVDAAEEPEAAVPEAAVPEPDAAEPVVTGPGERADAEAVPVVTEPEAPKAEPEPAPEPEVREPVVREPDPPQPRAPAPPPAQVAPVPPDARRGDRQPAPAATPPARDVVSRRLLWGTAFASAWVATLLILIYAATVQSSTPPDFLIGMWFLGWGAGGVFGAIAAGTTGLRNRALGVVIPLLSLIGIIPVFSADSNDAAGAVFASFIQLALLWGARRLTRVPGDLTRAGRR
ncbi:hypothetical protein GCM10009819_05530 [Agromyces tropicus]|uniref:CHAT domain-containing protein n=1 Tax=Agromyces tropicus TaxID=555371 RepID=A0ABN2TYM9_9MICO